MTIASIKPEEWVKKFPENNVLVLRQETIILLILKIRSGAPHKRIYKHTNSKRTVSERIAREL